MSNNRLIEILLVEDSELTRRIIKKCIDKNNQLTLLAAVNDPIEAAEFIKYKVPDIIILDIIMPKMTGIEFLEILMKQCPVPVIVFSSHTKNNSLLLQKAFDLGAINVVDKPICNANKFEKYIQEKLFPIIPDSINTYIQNNKLIKHNGDNNDLSPGELSHIDSNDIQVLIVDDSASARNTLQQIIKGYDGVNVMSVAIDPYMATEIIKQHRPDVILLDIEMPKMDGITYLKMLNKYNPIPVIICSSLVGNDKKLYEAFDEGAIDVIYKPRISVQEHFVAISDNLLNSIHSAAHVKQGVIIKKEKIKVSKSKRATRDNINIILIGASTGGVKAVETILRGITKNTPPIVVVLHMSNVYLNSLANRINLLCDINVKIANDYEELKSGFSYLSNGDSHLNIKKEKDFYTAYYTNEGPVNRHKPSIDVLFESASIVAKNHAVGVLLTGMGKDGAVSLKKMRDSGSYTIVQDEYTSIIYGMPKAALDIDAADEELPLERIANRLLELAE